MMTISRKTLSRRNTLRGWVSGYAALGFLMSVPLMVVALTGCFLIFLTFGPSTNDPAVDAKVINDLKEIFIFFLSILGLYVLGFTFIRQLGKRADRLKDLINKALDERSSSLAVAISRSENLDIVVVALAQEDVHVDRYDLERWCEKNRIRTASDIRRAQEVAAAQAVIAGATATP